MGLGGIIKAVIGIGDIFVNLANLVVLFVKLFSELIPAAVSLFNPVELMNDIIAGVFLGIKVIITGVVDMVMGGPKFAYNKCKDAGEGIFGYRRYRNSEGKLSAAEEVEKAKTDRRVCLRPSTFIMLITVLCPPLGLFLHLGINGWGYILVCAFLTIRLYYFPGLIYSIMHIIC